MNSRTDETVIVRIVVSQADMKSCLAIRTDVFVSEQGVDIKHEVDIYDETCVHAIALMGSTPVGTGRLINIHSNTAQIGRMAVIKEWRRHNIGTKLLHELENHAKTQGFTYLILHAQVYVQKFYQGNGYTATGDIFLDENIPHILMEKKLT